MKLGKNLSTQSFVLSHILILVLGLIFLGGLYYILHIQYQKITTPFSNGPVTTIPKSLRLDLEQPEDHTLAFEPSILISGKTGPGLEVLIFTDADNWIVKSKPDGSFSTVINLTEGVNRVVATVFDNLGDSRSSQKTIYYSKEEI